MGVSVRNIFKLVGEGLHEVGTALEHDTQESAVEAATQAVESGATDRVEVVPSTVVEPEPETTTVTGTDPDTALIAAVKALPPEVQQALLQHAQTSETTEGS